MKTKTRTQIIVRGVRLWPVQWRYVANVTLRGCYHLIMFFAGVSALALLAPRVPRLAADAALMRDLPKLYQFIPATVRDVWPIVIVAIFIGEQSNQFIDMITPAKNDDPATQNPIVLMAWGALAFLALAAILAYLGGAR